MSPQFQLFRSALSVALETIHARGGAVPLVAVDLFAGGGGASEGIRRATGACPVLAVNHDHHAIEMHAQNHPDSLHLRESVHDVDPVAVCGDTPVDLLWASPDCTHFSRAKGGKPRKKEIRGLAWVVVRWAKAVRPRVICLENVSEFQTWGPLNDDGQPDRARRGETFRAWLKALRDLGYAVEYRVLNAADYGAPTSRKRLFLVARRDGAPITWPAPTHGPGCEAPYRTAAECIDWSIPCPSIFTRKRPLAEKTQARIAEGIRRYVLTNPRPFLLAIDHQSGGGHYVRPLSAPVSTVTTKARHCVVAPSLLNLTHGGRLEPITEPARTITAAHRGEKALVAPMLINTRNGERAGQAPRTRDIQRPLGTVTAQGSQGAVVAAFLAKHYTGAIGQKMEAPLGTITAQDHHSLVSAHLTKFYGTSTGAPLDAPCPTITGGGWHVGLVAAFLLKYYGQGSQWSALDEPMHTVVSKARMGLVTVDLAGESYALVDIGMRMLQPRELAAAQGFGPDYVLTGTKTQKIARIGNSVCPPIAEALVAAQFGGPGCPDLQRDTLAAK